MIVNISKSSEFNMCKTQSPLILAIGLPPPLSMCPGLSGPIL